MMGVETTTPKSKPEEPKIEEKPKPEPAKPLKKLKTLNAPAWEVDLSESSGDEDGDRPKTAKIIPRTFCDRSSAIVDHDYCYQAFMAAQFIASTSTWQYLAVLARPIQTTLNVVIAHRDRS